MRFKFSANDFLLVLVAIIWGAGFVAQKIGAGQVGPYLFNGGRFLLGALVVLPFYLRQLRRPRPQEKDVWVACALIGGSLFAAALFQQIGIASTTSGKSGFITSLYVIIVPFMMWFAGGKIPPRQWLGSGLAVAGLAMLALTDRFVLESGDLFTLLSAVFWSLQAIFFHRFRHQSSLTIAFYQFLICGVLSFCLGLYVDEIQALKNAWAPLLYSGLVSVGIGFTLQVFAQQRAEPAHAVLFLSLEGVFAMLGGLFFLAEPLSVRSLLGALLILAAILLSQQRRRQHHCSSR